MANFHANILLEVTSAVAESPVVIVGMAQNPVVKKARKALDGAGIAYRYLEYGSYFGMWKERLAIKLWSGWPTFPQVFVKGALMGGAHETEAALADGSLKRAIDAG
jgi:glutaredoxin-related protein